MSVFQIFVFGLQIFGTIHLTYIFFHELYISFFLKGRTSNLGIHAVSNRPLKEKKLNDDYNKVEKIILCTLNIL